MLIFQPHPHVTSVNITDDGVNVNNNVDSIGNDDDAYLLGMGGVLVMRGSEFWRTSGDRRAPLTLSARAFCNLPQTGRNILKHSLSTRF